MKDRSGVVLGALLVVLFLAAFLTVGGMVWLSIEIARCERIGDVLGAETRYTVVDGCLIDVFGLEIPV